MWLDDACTNMGDASKPYGKPHHFQDQVSHRAIAFSIAFLCDRHLDTGTGKEAARWSIIRVAISKCSPLSFPTYVLMFCT